MLLLSKRTFLSEGVKSEQVRNTHICVTNVNVFLFNICCARSLHHPKMCYNEYVLRMSVSTMDDTYKAEEAGRYSSSTARYILWARTEPAGIVVSHEPQSPAF